MARAVAETWVGVVLAAGEGRRFGPRLKVLQPYQGEPLVRRAARALLAAGLSRVGVVVGYRAEQVVPALAGLPVAVLFNPAWFWGMAWSVRAAVRAAQGWRAQGLLITLADMPLVDGAAIRAVLQVAQRSPEPIVALEAASRVTPPVAYRASVWPALLRLRGDVGGRALFGAFPVRRVPWPDPRIIWDIDTMHDWQRLASAARKKDEHHARSVRIP
ncbi:MAG: nucleotidyltransferase family protein [Chloroflexi bacterium]|nr:nucleotidyltransferase family protein [Chloroflexota bacterium]